MRSDNILNSVDYISPEGVIHVTQVIPDFILPVEVIPNFILPGEVVSAVR